MTQALLWLAVAAAVSGALWGFRLRSPWQSVKRNRAPLALLASLALCVLVLEPLGMPFDWVLWVGIDLAVIAALLRHPVSDTPTRDIVILSLFVPAWVFYSMEPPVRFQGGLAVVITQLLLTFPAEDLQRWIRARMKGKRGNGGSDRLGYSTA